MVAIDGQVGAPPRDREGLSPLHKTRDRRRHHCPAWWAYGLYRYRVPPEEEEETYRTRESVYSLRQKEDGEPPSRRGRAGHLCGPTCGQEGQCAEFDSGSTLDLISTGRAQELGVATHSGGPNKVRLADGSLQACEETVDPARTEGRCSCHDATVPCHRLAHL
jgi:hypothetical protein